MLQELSGSPISGRLCRGGRRRRRWRRRRDGQSDGRKVSWRVQALCPVLDPLEGVVVCRVCVCISIPYSHVGDDQRAVAEVVKRNHSVGDHQHGVGDVAVVGRPGAELLQRADDVVAQEAHRAAGEAGQARHRRRLRLPHDGAEVIEWRQAVSLRLPAIRGGPAIHAAPSIAPRFRWLSREKCVPRPALAALERFQQEAESAAMKPGKRGDRGNGVEHQLRHQRHDRSRARECPELFPSQHHP